jgi:hypothetical protein
MGLKLGRVKSGTMGFGIAAVLVVPVNQAVKPGQFSRFDFCTVPNREIRTCIFEPSKRVPIFIGLF